MLQRYSKVSPLSLAMVTVSPSTVKVPEPEDDSIGFVCVAVNAPFAKVNVKSPQFSSLSDPMSSRKGEEASSSLVSVIFHVPSRAVGPICGDGLLAAVPHGAMT